MILPKSGKGTAAAAVRELSAGRVVVLPTDTVYGFSGVVPGSEGLIRRIKGRDEGKPFIRLVSSPDEILSYTDMPVPPVLLGLWPGALTIIVRLRDSLASSPDATAAFRCPGDSWLRRVIGECGSPLYSTSVNRTGRPPLRSAAEIEREFGGEVPLIVSCGDEAGNAALPSTIVEVSDGGCRVVRQGDLRVPDGLIASSM